MKKEDSTHNVNQRFMFVIKQKGYSGYKLSKEVPEISQSKLTHIRKERNEPSKELITALLEKFPDVSIEWLLTGKGDMLKTENAEDSNQPEEIFNKNGNSFVEISEGVYMMKIPLMEVAAQAGFADNYQDIEFISNINDFHTIITKEIHKGKYVAFRVQNESMNNGKSNAILSGDIVTGRELQQIHWRDKLRYRKFPYWIIATKDSSMPLLKEIINHDVEKGIITCHSLNESPEYSDFELSLNNVTALFYVVDVSRTINPLY